MQVKVRVYARTSPTDVQMRNPTYSLSGILYLQVDDTFFPYEGAGTYVVENLGFWMESAMILIRPESEIKNIYKDNNCEFYISRAAGSDCMTIRLHDHDGRLMSSRVISYKRYLAALRGAAKSLLNEIDEKGLDGGADTDTLRDRLKHLERLEASIKERGLP